MPVDRRHMMATVLAGSTSVPVPPHEFTVNTFSVQPDGAAGFDNYIGSFGPDANQGSAQLIQFGESSLAVGDYARGLLKFDLSTIPATSKIISCDIDTTLILDGTARASANGHAILFRLLRDWTELGSTFNKYDGTNAWGTAGARGAADSNAIGDGTGDYFNADLSGAVRTISLSPIQLDKIISGAVSNYGWIMKMSMETNDAYRIGSSDNTTAGNRPKITIKYIPAEDVPYAIPVTFCGDSKTEFHVSWPNLLLTALYTATTKPYIESPSRLVVSGTTADALHTYVDTNIGALSGSPKYTLLNIGTNDLIAGTAEATYKAGLTGIIDAYLAKFPSTLVYVAYPWQTGKDAESATMKTWIDAVIATYGSRVFAGHDENTWLKPNVATYTYDNIHPNINGNIAHKNQWMTVLGSA